MGPADAAVAAEDADAHAVPGYLDRPFPDARFVMTHRDPTDVMLSVSDVYADIFGSFTDHLDRRYIGELNVDAVVGRGWTAR